MPLTVKLTGSRHTDGSEGRVALTPRVQWSVTSGTSTTAPGPLYFKIGTDGTLTTLSGGDAKVVPTYDSQANMTFSPEGSAYVAKVSISGQEIFETWTIDGANAELDWATLGIKPSASDRVTYPTPLTVDSPVRHYTSSGSIPAGIADGAIVYVSDTEDWYGISQSLGAHRISS